MTAKAMGGGIYGTTARARSCRLGRCLSVKQSPLSPAVLSRCSDCVLHAYGCDAVLEENCILIQGRSVEQWEGVDVPKAQGWRHGRLDVRAFKAKIEILSPTSASTSIMANVDPRAPLPKSLINFVVRTTTRESFDPSHEDFWYEGERLILP